MTEPVKLAFGATNKPIDQIPPQLRLGTLITRARLSAEKTTKELADSLGLSVDHIESVVSGQMPLPAQKLQEVSSILGCDYEGLVQAARDFHTSVWEPAGERTLRLETATMDARGVPVPAFVMPPEQVFVEYREGWTAGASGRLNPGDMSPAWESGHEDGRVARESALHQRQVDLGVHYEGAEPAPNGGSR